MASAVCEELWTGELPGPLEEILALLHALLPAKKVRFERAGAGRGGQHQLGARDCGLRFCCVVLGLCCALQFWPVQVPLPPPQP